jgi:hypothetical protein
VYTESGDVCIAHGIVRPVLLPDFELFVVTKAGDTSEDEALQALTDELRDITEKVTSHSLPNFQIRWGVRSDSLPFLVDGPTVDAPEGHIHELLCLALEVALVAEPGVCITLGRVCVGAGFTVPRIKVAHFRIRKFFERAVSGDVLDAIIQRVSAKFGEAAPKAAFATVACCRHCFALYSVTAVKSAALAPPPPKQKTFQKRRTTRPSAMPRSLNHLVPFQKLPSGITVVQDISAQAHRVAYGVYSSDPFPPFRQRH